jgi:multiple sugar transport system ATP-binding protein
VVILDHGRLLQVDVPRVIYEQPADRFVATFVGSPPMNILPCQIEPASESVRILPVGADASSDWSTTREWLPTEWDGQPCRLDLGIRPEGLALHDSQESNLPGSSFAHLTAQVRDLEFSGPEVLATLAAGPHRLVARWPATQRAQVRDAVRLTFDLRTASWFDPVGGCALRCARR